MPKMSEKERAAAAVAASNYEVPERKQFDPGPGINTESGDLTRNALQAEALIPKPSLSEGWGAAQRLEMLHESTARTYVDSTFDPDENFQWTPERWTQHTKGVPAEHHKHLLRARSDSHAMWIADNIKREIEDSEKLGRMGMAGIGLRIGAAVADPAQLLLAIGTGGATVIPKATRIANAVRSGLSAGVTNAALEGFLNSQQVTRDSSDVFEAGLLGFVIGAPIGALSKVENATLRALARSAHDQSVLGRADEAGIELNDAGKKALSGARVKTPVEQADYWMKQIEGNEAAAAGSRAADVAPTGVSPTPTPPNFIERIFLHRTNRKFDKFDDDAPKSTPGFADRRGHYFSKGEPGEGYGQRLVRARLNLRNPKVWEDELPPSYLTKDSIAKMEGEGHDGVIWRDGEEAVAFRSDQIEILPDEAPRKAEAPAAEDLGRVFAPGDTVWFEKGDELISGKVQTLAGNGKVMVKDDVTGKVVGFHPDADDPLGEYSGITAKADAEPAMFKRGSIGSAQVADIDVPETKYSEIKIGKFSIPVRWDYFAIFMRSGNTALKRLAQVVIADSVGYADKTITRGLTATEAAELMRLKYEKRFLASFEDGFADYYKRLGVWNQAEKARNVFADAVTMIVRGDTDAARNIPEAAKAVAEVRAIHKEILEQAQKHGVEGAEHVDPDPFYMMRKFNHDRIRMIAGKYDEKAVTQLIADAIRSSRPDIDPELLDKVAKGYWTTVRKLQYRLELSEATYGPKQFFALRESLKGKVDDETLDDVIEMLAGRTLKKEGDHPRLKARTQLDETYAADVLTKDGKLERLSIADLFISDSRLLMRQYSRQMSGLIGFARVGIRSEADWTRRLQEVADEAEEKSLDKNKVAKHIEHLKSIRNFTLGRPMSEQVFGTGDRVLRVLRDLNFMRNMGQAGFAQIPEIGNTIGLAGMRAFTMHMPAFRDILKHATAGRLDDEFSRDLMNMGLGMEHLAIKPNLREMDEWAFDRNLSTIERLTEKGKYLTANIGGLAAMNDALHTLASKAFVQKFSDYAQGITKLKQSDLARLNWAGIGEDNIDGVFARLKKHTKLGENGRVEGIDWEGWQAADPDSFDTFNLAVFRESRKAIQQPTIGETAPWMHTQLGKLLTQFRTFTLVAWAKQGLHNIHYADASTAVAWGLSMVFAGGAYVAQNSINFAHNDAERAKRLQLKEIAKAAYQRAGFASLTPAIADTVLQFTRGEPMFAYGRTTGLGTGFLVGNPTVDLLSAKMLGTLQNSSRAVFDDEHMWTRKDVKNGLGLFLPNYIGIRNFVDAASNEFPSRNFLEQREQR